MQDTHSYTSLAHVRYTFVYITCMANNCISGGDLSGEIFIE